MGDSTSFDITAPIHHIGQVQQVTEKFRKRDLVLLLDAGTKWPQMVPFTVSGDRCERLDDFREGETVKVTFNLRGREWSKNGTTKFFGELAAFKIDLVGDKSRGPTPPAGGGSAGVEDDLPF